MTGYSVWTDFWLAVYVTYAIAFLGYCTGCADVGDYEVESAEHELSVRPTPPPGRGTVGPYRPAPTHQGVYPQVLWNSALETNDPAWSWREGGSNAWYNSWQQPSVFVAARPEYRVSRPLAGSTCSAPVQLKVACRDGSLTKRTYTCPEAYWPAPFMYENRVRSGQYVYKFDQNFVVITTPRASPARMEVHRDSNGETYLSCAYVGYQSFRIGLR